MHVDVFVNIKKYSDILSTHPVQYFNKTVCGFLPDVFDRNEDLQPQPQ